MVVNLSYRDHGLSSVPISADELIKDLQERFKSIKNTVTIRTLSGKEDVALAGIKTTKIHSKVTFTLSRPRGRPKV